MRGAGLSNYLQSSLGMNLNGLILISPFSAWRPATTASGTTCRTCSYLSTLAATAWYYDAIADKPASLEAYSAEVERFACNEYAPRCWKGCAIPAEEKQAIREARSLYRHDAEFPQRADLRVSHVQFLQKSCGRGLIAGRIDSVFRALTEPAQ